jgi:sugar transferase (PEP-CTERM/EpsH1 system associated)
MDRRPTLIAMRPELRTGRAAASGQLRLLFVAQRFPYPLDTGGKIRTGKLLEHLSRVAEITLVSQVDPVRDAPHLPEARRFCAAFHAVPVPELTRRQFRFYARVLRHLFARYPAAVLKDYSPAYAATVRALATSRRFDLIVCDFLQPSLHLEGLHGRLPAVLFQHNVESLIWRRYAQTCANPLLRAFWRQQWRKMEDFERQASRRFDAVIAVSDLDRETFLRFGARRVFTIPMAVDTEQFRPWPDPPDPDTLIFVGSMDWRPNEDAVRYFVDHILPRVAAQRPAVRFTVVGRDPSPALLRRLRSVPGVACTGRVEDVRPYVARHAVCVLPLRVGGGTRIKVFEIMAMGKALVSTTIGVEGLPVVPGRDVLVADTPEAFAGAVVALLSEPRQRQALERAARHLVSSNYGWDRAAESFRAACQAVVSAWAPCY